MTASWPEEELHKIAAAADLYIAPLRDDSSTYGTPTLIWAVAVEGGLYVRAYNGQSSRWFQAALRQKAGRIIASGQTKKVVFESADEALSDRTDAAYEKKYLGNSYLRAMTGSRAKSATFRITPCAQ
jgi:hypothetical protein